jgi:hypothetical protein
VSSWDSQAEYEQIASEASAAVRSGAAAVDLAEFFEHEFLHIFGHADLGVRDRKRDHPIAVTGLSGQSLLKLCQEGMPSAERAATERELFADTAVLGRAAPSRSKSDAGQDCAGSPAQ